MLSSERKGLAVLKKLRLKTKTERIFFNGEIEIVKKIFFTCFDDF